MVFFKSISEIYPQNFEPIKYYPIKKSEKPYEMYISKKYAILRSNPTTYAFEIAILNQGEKVKVLFHSEASSKTDKSYDWYFVKTDKGYQGWLYGSFLSKNNPTSEDLQKDQVSTETISKEIAGIWWEVDEFDSTRYRKFEFTLDKEDSKKGTFSYSFRDSNKIEGDFEIKNNGKVILKKNLSIGNVLNFIKNTEGYRIIIENNNKKYFFKKSIIQESKDKVSIEERKNQQ